VIHDDNTVLDRFTWGIIRRKARQMVGHAGIKKQDRDDVVQELMLRLLQSLRLFDAAQADRKSFVTAVVERNAAKILRDRRAKKRDGGRIDWLDVLLEALDEEPTDLAIDDRAAGQADLAIDVADLLDPAAPRRAAAAALRGSRAAELSLTLASVLPRTGKLFL
jgi:DNA-directed RNA polymerase specialized sigma24 family protein